MSRYTLAAIVVLTTVGVSAAAWQARDASTPAPSGSGSLRGVVVADAADPQPVRRATVHLSGAGTVPRLVGTDDLGRFAFDRLPAGRYTLSATKVGFVRAFHGSTEPGVGPGVPVAVSDEAPVDVAIRLLPGAVITGVVSDARGVAAAGVSVAAVDTRLRAGTTPTPARLSPTTAESIASSESRLATIWCPRYPSSRPHRAAASVRVPELPRP